MTEINRLTKAAIDTTTRAMNAAEVAKGKMKVKRGKVLGDCDLRTEGKARTCQGKGDEAGSPTYEGAFGMWRWGTGGTRAVKARYCRFPPSPS